MAAVLALHAAEQAFLDEDYEQVLLNARQLPDTSLLYLRALDLMGEAYLAEGRLKSAVLAWTAAIKNTPEGIDHGLFVMKIAEVYAGIEGFETAYNWFKQMPANSAYAAQAFAERTENAYWGAYIWKTLAWGSILEGPLADQWFLPGLDVYGANAYLYVCRYDQANIMFHHATDRLGSLQKTLEMALLEGDDELWARWQTDKWGDRHLSYYLHSDPNLTRLDTIISHSLPMFVDRYRAEALGWMRRRLQAAEKRRSLAAGSLPELQNYLTEMPLHQPMQSGVRVEFPYLRRRYLIFVKDTFQGTFNYSDAERYYYGGKDMCHSRKDRLQKGPT